MVSEPLLPDLFTEQATSLTDQVSFWPQVCLAEVWQPAPPARPQGLLPRYSRRLFAAQDWAPVLQAVDRCSLYQYGKRPTVVTRYSTDGPQLPLVLQAVALGMALPRTYAVDGLLRPRALERERPSGQLPLLGTSGTWVGRSWNTVRQVWQSATEERDGDQLRGLGIVMVGHDRAIVQPIDSGSAVIDRRSWFESVKGTNGYDNPASASFETVPPLGESQLVARAIAPVQPHYRLNPGLLEKLHLHARKDPLAPHRRIAGMTVDASRPQQDWLVVLPQTAEPPCP